MRRNNSGLAVTIAVATALAMLTQIAAADDRPTRRLVAMRHIPGSTTKLEQLIGDYDKHLERPTRNRTRSRYGVHGTDLGTSFEHDGKLFFLFGDTIGPGGGDCLATSSSTSPDAGLELDFLRGRDKNYLKIRPPGISMGGFEVPSGGISLGGKIYLFCTTDHSRQQVMGRSVLVRFDPSTKRFATLRDISKRPGNFINIAARLAPPGTKDLPQSKAGGGQQVLLWGSGAYRNSHAYLACTPADQIEHSQATRYFAGLDDRGTARWAHDEQAAKPVVEHPVIGELSVTWCEPLSSWIMTYNSRQPRGITLRWSPNPWGPWSDGIQIFAPWRDGGYGKFMRAPSLAEKGRSDQGGPWGPTIAPKGPPENIWGGEYGPYVIERFTSLSGDTLTIYFVMSTWNPYTVLLMKSQLDIELDGA